MANDGYDGKDEYIRAMEETIGELRADLDIIREWYGAESIDGLLHQKQGDVDACRAAYDVRRAPCVKCGLRHDLHPTPTCQMWVGSATEAVSGSSNE